MVKSSATPVELLVVGAGPVGLFAALSAAERGLQVRIIDESWRGYSTGHARVLHARTLGLLSEAGVASALHEIGRPLPGVRLHVDDRPPLACELPAPALVVPQSALEDLLLRALRAHGIDVDSTYQATGLEEADDSVLVHVLRRELVTLGSPAHYTDWEPVASSGIRARFVLAADGYDSRLRRALGVDRVELDTLQSFAIFDAAPVVDSLRDLELGFDDELSMGILPLPQGRARFSFQVMGALSDVSDLGRLHRLLASRAAWYAGGVKSVEWGTVADFERAVVTRFGLGRVWLAGDAAHVTSPLGNQSVNVGLYEAHNLVARIADCLRGHSPAAALDHYDIDRQREWRRLLGVHVHYEGLPHAPSWAVDRALDLVPALPASGRDLERLLEQIGLVAR